MIAKINSLKGLGIFNDYTAETTLKEFNRFNLFYGKNGSGKSTLATLFRNIELKTQSAAFPSSQWEIICDSGNINNSNVEENNINIRVFNKSFVEENIFTAEGIKGIVYISEKSGDEKLQLDKKEVELEDLKKKYTKISSTLNGDPKNRKHKGLKELNSAFLTDAARKIKAQFKVVEVEDTRLLNYDRRKLGEFISEFKNEIKLNKSQLSVTEIEKLSKSIKPQDKTLINIDEYRSFDLNLFNTAKERVQELCSTSITSQSINRLKQHPEIANWVYQGLKEIHSSESTNCEFCGQPLPTDRISELNKHFSDEFSKLQQDILNGIEWLHTNCQEMVFPHSSMLYEELISEYEQRIKEYNNISSELKLILNSWIAALQEKQKNPFNEHNSPLIAISKEKQRKYNDIYNKIISCIGKHNTKFLNLDEEISKTKQKLELHYVSEELATYNYFDKKDKEEKLAKEQQKVVYEIDSIKSSINHLRASLANEHLGEQKFNDMLHKFLGRNDLCIKHRKEGGYTIKRNETESVSNNSLSEGEKTAIALVYFITKIKEYDNNAEDTIIVLDDPISSFDSNHLFHACYYIKEECENAKQLFVFTHSFKFFALMKDWICRQIVKDSNNKNIPTYHLYLIKPYQKNEIRHGNIENACNVLTHFDSEYHLLFSEVKQFCDNPKLDYISTHTIANISRQLLESFLSFKFGRKKLSKCFDDILGFPDIDKVRKFVNHYSHKMDGGNSTKGFNDNIFSEADKITPLVLDLIKYVDNTHYTSMIDRLNGR